MKHSKLTLSLKSIAIAGASAFLLTGCLTKGEDSSYKSDGQSAYMTSELDQMGQIYAGSTGVSAKTSATGLTVTGELLITPYAYQAACNCFLRSATFTTTDGFERLRIDSVTLFDSAGTLMTTFQPAVIGKIVHTRNVSLTKGSRQADMRFAITADIKTQGGDKVGVWNGTMTGSYNGQALKSGSLVNVTRVWENGRFHFPMAGTAELDRPIFHFLVEFLGDNKAQVTIKNKINNKVHTLFVDKAYGESAPVEKL